MTDESTLSAGLDINARIAAAVRRGRADRKLSLEELATASGVSRSMLSLIERGETSPTAVVLEKVATALGVPLARLFDHSRDDASPVSRKVDRAIWKDPETGYQRWNISPPGYPSPLQIVEVLFPPHARVAFETGVRDHVVHQQVWVQDGRIEITLGDTVHQLAKGDCLAMQLDTTITYHNRTDKPARYVVVLVTLSPPVARRSA
ncbi:helix-turn-helix domain-containing protein [Pseudorhodoferax sp. Leaf267]|uniref:helix-turn-helix domain-containing protein n=1 Tax=Pseudorhodoferax sp. Leaf267 TaxID=1736316 RepID=UPI0006FE47B0|nr:XRE family transcriptional regulator [Pseudorhodoferax sp. Leaf267]KQP21939.1 DNA-binding protein [Pseudorhodoferax sp. Leaf267]